MILFATTFSGFSQTIIIKDKDTGEPLQLVALISEKPKAYATTNPNGQAGISAFEGAEKITITLLGYQKVVVSYAELAERKFFIELQKTHLNIDEIVVSAAPWQQPSTDFPLKATSIQPA